MNWEKNFKSKEAAIVHIFDCLAQNRGVVGNDGVLGIMFRGEFIRISPPKKKKQYAQT